MVTLELQLPSAKNNHPGSFQQIDAVAALQHLIGHQHAAGAVASQAKRAAPEVRTSLQLPQTLAPVPRTQDTGRSSTVRSHQIASSSPRGSYSNDGVRLSDLGEQPLAVGRESTSLGQRELSIGSPDPDSNGGSHSITYQGLSGALHSRCKKYVCNTKDDPLVKGRPALPNLFRQKGAFSLLQPLPESDLSFTPSAISTELQQPILLQNLQAFLAEKLQTASRLQEAYSQQDRSTLATANLALDAYRQVFEAFIHSFTTYRPLLLKIRGAYEEALQDALSSQADNIHMKAQLAVLHQRKADAVNKAKGSGNDAAVSGRGALYERLLDAQGRQEQASGQAEAEETGNAAATAELRAARAEAADLKMRIAKARATMYASSSFAQMFRTA